MAFSPLALIDTHDVEIGGDSDAKSKDLVWSQTYPPEIGEERSVVVRETSQSRLRRLDLFWGGRCSGF